MTHRLPAGSSSVEVHLHPDDLVEAWRPASRRLFLPVQVKLQLRQKVAVRLHVVGAAVAATVTGTVVSVHRHGALFRIELVPDDARVPVVERLAKVARGEGGGFLPRSARLLARLPAVVATPHGPVYMTTFSVSAQGCGLVWSGPLPLVGQRLDLRFGAGNQVATFHALVCWCSKPGRGATVGVRFVAGHEAPWKNLLADAERNGAPPI